MSDIRFNVGDRVIAARCTVIPNGVTGTVTATSPTMMYVQLDPFEGPGSHLTDRPHGWYYHRFDKLEEEIQDIEIAVSVKELFE